MVSTRPISCELRHNYSWQRHSSSDCWLRHLKKEHHFAHYFFANIANLHFQLMDLSNCFLYINDYLKQAKALADYLADINKLVENDDFVAMVVRGLGADYLMLHTTILQFLALPSLGSSCPASLLWGTDFLSCRRRCSCSCSPRYSHTCIHIPVALQILSPNNFKMGVTLPVMAFVEVVGVAMEAGGMLMPIRHNSGLVVTMGLTAQPYHHSIRGWPPRIGLKALLLHLVPSINLLGIILALLALHQQLIGVLSVLPINTPHLSLHPHR